MTGIRKILKSIMPPICFNIARRIVGRKYGWKGNYQTWGDASKDAAGYDVEGILEKVRLSTRKVRDGKVIFERDGVLFDEIQYFWPLLAGLLLVAARRGGSLRVLDFGGSLGTSYYQNKKFLSLLDDVSWNIVEQPHYVKAGKEDFEDYMVFSIALMIA